MDADFILAHGTEAIGLPDGSTQDMSLQQLQNLIQQCADVAKQRGRELPMVVANPDLVSGTCQWWAITKGWPSVMRTRSSAVPASLPPAVHIKDSAAGVLRCAQDDLHWTQLVASQLS